MRYLTGDLLYVRTGIIVHQVNTRHVAGSGLALAIRKRWPCWWEAYMAADPILGRVMYYRVSEDLTVASVYGQEGFGTQKRRTNYAALGKALFKLGEDTRGGRDPQVYIPYRMGCGLAGGDWTIVQAIIEDALPHAVIVRRPQD